MKRIKKRKPTSRPRARTIRRPRAMAASHVAMRTLFDHAWDAMLVADRKRRIVDANPAACKMFGMSKEELLSLRADDLRRDYSKARYKQLLDGVLRPPVVRGEHSVRFRDGSRRTLDTIGVRIDSNHAFFAVRDVTELKQADEKLKASEEMFRSMMRDAGPGIVFTDLQGVHVDVNDAFCAMTGFSREELIGCRRPYPYWPKDLLPRFEHGMQNALEGRISVVETALVKKNRERLPVRIHPSFVRDHTGKTVGVIGIFEDISSWEMLQQELINAQKMQTVGALASGIVHEFNNLHCGIRLIIENALAVPSQPAAMRNDLELVLERLERASSVTGHLRAFVQKTPSHRALASLSGVVRETLDIAAATLKKDKITVVSRLDEDGPELVMDRVLMSQALLNLILNARDAMDSSEVKRLQVESGVTDGRAFVRLSDTGSGIAAEYVGNIFDPFFTTREDRRERVRSGFGLGLTVAEAIVREHGGTIDVSSTVGAGSAFTVWLPLEVPSSSARVSYLGEIRDKVKGRKVLVSENDSALRALLDSALRQVGCLVDACGSVGECVHLLAGGKYDIVVIGLGLVGEKTRDVLTAVRKLNPADRPVTVVVTAAPDAAGRKMAAGPRPDAIMHAPVTLESLYAAVEAAVTILEYRRESLAGRNAQRSAGTEKRKTMARGGRS